MTSKVRGFSWMSIILSSVAFAWMAGVWAQSPNNISYSGVLTDTLGEPRDGTFDMTFRIYDQFVGGNLIGMPVPVSNVVVRKGQFNVVLGPFPDNVFLQGGGDRYLEVQIGSDPPLLPRQRLISVPFAQRAGSIDGAKGGSIIGPAASDGTGRISSVSTNVTGTSTSFTTELNVGDTITAQGQTRIVRAITSPTALSTTTAFSPRLTNATFTFQKPIARFADSGGNVQAIVDSRGNVGIGTASPVSKLHVSGGNTIVDGNVGIGTRNPTNKLEIVGGNVSIVSYQPFITLTDVDNNKRVRMYGVGGTFGFHTDWALQIDEASLAIRDVPGTTGNVGIGYSYPAYKLDVNGAARIGGMVYPSDIRLKDNVSSLIGALEKLDMIRGVSFEWNVRSESFGHTKGRKDIGVIAQEVEAVFPEVVAEDKEGFKAVDYARLTAVLIEAVKELKAENAALKRRMDVLEGKASQE